MRKFVTSSMFPKVENTVGKHVRMHVQP
jgi:hypothetical protein